MEIERSEFREEELYQMSPLDVARQVLRIEIEALEHIKHRLSSSFEEAVEVLYRCRGKIVVTGLGKSGIAARKIAATFASTGAPALFLHAGEAVHGDLGVVGSEEVAVAISYSGETREVIELVPRLKLLGVSVIALTGNPQSTLAGLSDLHLDVSVPSHPFPFGIIPTASHLAAVAVGDALAISLLIKRGITENDFALLHPGGVIGRRLLVKVGDLMHIGDELPIVTPHQPMRQVLTIMTSKRLGVTCVVEGEMELVGIITDGDLRRLLERHPNPLELTAREVMTVSPKTITPEVMAVRALHKMEEYAITSLPVVDGNRRLVGLIHMHDILKLETHR
ncbi:MAG: SIS domain-containing protein [bacterium]